MAVSGGGFPSWLLLEPFVFRRDDDESFPDETMAPIRATGTTTWGASFRIAFSPAEPPRISRLYAQLPVPGFLDRRMANPLRIVGTHRHLALIRVGTRTSEMVMVQNFFIFNAKHPSSSLKLLPPCTEPAVDYTRRGCPLPRQQLPPDATPRLLYFLSLGFWCQGEEFVVAELTLFRPIHQKKVFADICLLQSTTKHSTRDGRDKLGGTWKTMRVEFLSTENPADADLFQITWWRTDAIIPFDKWLCWIDYQRGILFCDMSKLPKDPTVSFIWFPLKLPITGNRKDTSTCWYRAVSVVDGGRALKFVNITRQDGIAVAALKPGTGFTITCHTLVVLDSGSMAWKEDYTVTSAELWGANTPERLPHRILMFPQIDIDRPHVAHFLSIEFGYVNKKMWLVSIDMSTKTVESVSLYINGNEGLATDDAEFIEYKSTATDPFIPCEFPELLNLSRKRKGMK